MISKNLQKLATLASPSVRRSFCIYKVHLNPEKHITMSHNVHNMYEDVIMVGDVILPTKTNEKVASRKYEAKILDLVFTHLNAKYPKAKLDKANYQTLAVDGWLDHGIDMNNEREELLELLAKNIFVKENKFRYPIEQRNRLSQTQQIFSYVDLNQTLISFFVESYLNFINIYNERSNLWLDPKIKGAASALESYNTDYRTQEYGISALNRDIPENNNLINRIMAKLHS